jgi:tryptophan halogenase
MQGTNLARRCVTIVGGGNAGLVCALVLRRAFADYEITVVKSDKIGTIGVGEGSTEHWLSFMNFVEIPVAELLIATLGTHKKGIRFEDWTNHTPDYFHSISGLPDNPPFVFNFNAAYAKLIVNGSLMTDAISPLGIRENKVQAVYPHRGVNQFHFDTQELNDFFVSKAKARGIKFVDGEVKKVNVSEEWVGSVELADGEKLTSDFWIDASGFNRVLMSRLPDEKWNSFGKYLLTDSAIAFRTPPDESGQIRPYTRSRAMKSGWAWEIPTQIERGNGYVYSSQHCSEGEAVHEMEELLDDQLSDFKQFKFDPGYLEKAWVGNCVAIGLSGSFVEPLEATSIGTTINQCFALIAPLASFRKGHTWVAKEYNHTFEKMMLNILSMIRLHYISDRDDSPFWIAQQEMPMPEELEHLLGVWAERAPVESDVHGMWNLFGFPHFYYVGQGQGVISRKAAQDSIDALGLNDVTDNYLWNLRESRNSQPVKDHAETLKELTQN